MKTCQNCGAEMADNMNFCPQCHAKYEAPTENPNAPTENTPAAGNPAPPAAAKKRNLAATIGGIVLIICVVWAAVFPRYIFPKLADAKRAENLQKALVDYGFPKDKIEVRHLDGNKFGVWVISIQIGDEKIYYNNDENDEPGFCLFLNKDTNKFEFSSPRDRKNADCYRKAACGDDDALLNLE